LASTRAIPCSGPAILPVGLATVIGIIDMKWHLLRSSSLTLLLVALSVAGCRSATPANEEEATGPSTMQAKTGPETEVNAGMETGDASAASVEATFAVVPDGDEMATSLPQSLEALLVRIGDYQVEVDLSFQGQDQAGALLAFETVGRETATSNPPGSRLDLTYSGANELGQIQAMSLSRSGDAAYLYVPEIGCISGNAGEMAADMKLPVDPRDIMEGITGAWVVSQGVVVNGVTTDELHFDEGSSNWPPESTWSVDGAIFVEEGGDFVTRITATLDGQGDLLGDGRELAGTFQIDVEITAIEDSVAILPQACRASSLYPVTPDAFDMTAIQDLLAYKSSAPLQDVVDFYMSAMPVAGWQLASEPDVFEDLAVMTFERGGASLMVTLEVEAGSGVTSVFISP
jgi:hypothetical protein